MNIRGTESAAPQPPAQALPSELISLMITAFSSLNCSSSAGEWPRAQVSGPRTRTLLPTKQRVRQRQRGRRAHVPGGPRRRTAVVLEVLEVFEEFVLVVDQDVCHRLRLVRVCHKHLREGVRGEGGGRGLLRRRVTEGPM